LGYRQLRGALEGDRSEDEAVTETIVGTRRFVRRQRSWFRRDGRLTWIDAAESDLVNRCARVATARSVP
jgi:tRNA dimethylallyltransferase